MARNGIYSQVVALTVDLGDTVIPKKYFAEIANGHASAAAKCFEDFKTKYPDLHQRIINFGNIVRQLVQNGERETVRIFGTVVEYDSDLINPLDFLALALWGNIREVYFFTDEDFWGNSENLNSFLGSLKALGFKHLSNFIREYNIDTFIGYEYDDLTQLLVAICYGKHDN